MQALASARPMPLPRDSGQTTSIRMTAHVLGKNELLGAWGPRYATATTTVSTDAATMISPASASEDMHAIFALKPGQSSYWLANCSKAATPSALTAPMSVG